MKMKSEQTGIKAGTWLECVVVADQMMARGKMSLDWALNNASAAGIGWNEIGEAVGLSAHEAWARMGPAGPPEP
jgi:hypothetical protein